jgi:hypothetical protein
MLPLSYVDTNYTLPTGCATIAVGTVPSGGCKVITVAGGQSFQTALTQARRGDIIQLDGNATFAGPFTLPDKPDGPGWVYIISSGYGNLPAPGNRIIPDDMGGPCGDATGVYCGATPNVAMGADVATITGNGSPVIAIQTANGADRYRFIGVEIKPAPGQFASSLIRVGGGGETGVSDIIFDRIVSRGDPSAGGRRAFLIQGDGIGIINSYLSNWWEVQADTQAILLSDFTDVFAAINNYLEATGENFYSDTGTNNVADQPSDIEFRGNLVRKANDWRARCGGEWPNIKNLFEVKAGHRILIEANEFQDAWADNGAGARCGQESAINIKQGDEVSNKHTTHVTFRLNHMVRVGNAMKFCMAHCNSFNDSSGHDFAVYNNIVEVDGNTYGGNTGSDGAGFYHWVSAGNNLIADHNTIINNGRGVAVAALGGGVGAPGGGRFTNNILYVGGDPFTTSEANAMWPSGYIYTTNLIVGGSCASFPSGNRCPTSWAAVGFTNFNGGVGGDYTLAPGSTHKGIGTDPFGIGTTDPGANVPLVNAVTACAISGQCAGPSNGDSTPPNVSLTTPTESATVSGTITLSANASDASGIAGVQFMVDGNNVGSEVTQSPYSVSWNSTTVANGVRTISARARDTAGNTATSSVIVTVQNGVPGDTTPPAVSMSAPANGATVSGTVTVSAGASDNVAVVGVQFILDGSNLGAEDTSGPYSISWNTTSVANGSHTLRARARDAAGNTTTSATITVNVQNQAPGSGDTAPPSVSISAPVNGATVANTISISANASDNVGVVGVQFLLKGANLGGEDTTSPFTISWNTAGVSNGSYTLSARARDAAGNMQTSAGITITVQNQVVSDTTPPTVVMTSPANGSTVSGNVTVSANATDNVAVAGVQFRLNGQLLGPEDNAAPYSLLWNAAGVPAGTHALSATARDAAGNTSTSATVTVTVQNAQAGTDTTPPNVVVTSPKNGATVSGSVLFAVDASDNVGVAQVQFILDGTPLGAPLLVAPYSLSWNTKGTTAGAHTITALARDAAGNSRTAAVISFTIKEVSNGAGPRGSIERVSWTDLVNSSVYLWRLRKTGGCDSCADAGARSTQRITSGDGYVEFTASKSDKVYFVGLGPDTPGTSPEDLDFGVRVNGLRADVYEANAPKASEPTRDGDTIRISVVSGSVTYSRNGSVFYTSQRQPQFPLAVRAVLMDRRAEVSRASFWRPAAAAGAPPPVSGLNGGIDGAAGARNAPVTTPNASAPGPAGARRPPTQDDEPRKRPTQLEFDRTQADVTMVAEWALSLAADADSSVAGIYLYAVVNSKDEPVFLGAVSPEYVGLSADESKLARERIAKALSKFAPGSYTVAAYEQMPSGAPQELGTITVVIR